MAVPEEEVVQLHSFPFDHVIITFPDAAAARTAELGPIPSFLQTSKYRSVRFTATADPYDARVGSGGGTAAALYDHTSSIDESTTSSDTTRTAFETKTTNPLHETVLILHAGGAASRCPTQMCLGKAWTSLPSFGIMSNEEEEEEEDMESITTKKSLYTPLQVWLDLCQRIFGGSDGTHGHSSLPPGSVVVVASDTLLQLEDDLGIDKFGTVDWSTELMHRNTVLGLAVPAPLSTAKNHGVFVPTITPEDSNSTNTTSQIRIASCRTVLQKPSIEEMESMTDCCFTDPLLATTATDTKDHDNDSHSKEWLAWIDTGVTIFSPSAARTLYDFTHQHLQRCTTKGLKQLYHEQLVDNRHESNESSTSKDLSTFASKMAMSVDLYTHFLQALALSNESVDAQMERKEKFMQTYSKELPTEIIEAIWIAFSSCTLQILAVPNARFWHLGTTVELHNFLVDACSHNTVVATTTTMGTRPIQCQKFGLQLGFIRRLRAYTKLGGNRNGESCVHTTAVIYDSILSVHRNDSYDPSNGITQSYIGSRTVIEHCNVDITNGSIRIGTNCLVSGLRSPPNPTCKIDLYIPDNMIIQMVQLSAKIITALPSPVVIMALHMNDDIKKKSTMYGLSVENFLRNSGLQESDIWDVSNTSPSIWTAKIHPVIDLSNNESFASVFSWLCHLDSSDGEPDKLKDDKSFLYWKNCRRLSLSEIRDVSDATQEFAFRSQLVSLAMPTFMSEHIHSIKTMLCERQHSIPIDFQFLVDAYTCVDVSGPQSSGHCSISDVMDTVHVMDHVIQENVNRDESRDIAARAAMLLGGLLDDVVTAAPILSSTGKTDNDMTNRLSSISTALRESLERNEMNETLDAYNNLALLRDECITTKQIPEFTKIAIVMEDLASILTGLHIRAADGMQTSMHCQPPMYDKWVVATAPARIDLSGGWSDTPPVCYEFGSTVTGMAVRIDHKKPLACRCRVILGGTGMLLRTEHRSMKDGALLSELQIEITSLDSFQNYRDPTSDCALLKCVLVHLGFIPSHLNATGMNDFQTTLNQFCRSETTSVRLELVATSVLPHGSGLGTSSILAGCILAAVGKCIGTGNYTLSSSSSSSNSEYLNEIIDSVLNVEQYLTTGGGFQDQVNGLFGGMKVSSSLPNVHPMKIKIETLAMNTEFENELNRHIYLVYTGTTRLAKNLLKQVLYRWSKHTPEIMETIHGLVNGAVKCRNAIEMNDLDEIGQCLSEYWTHKKVMAGPDSGVEPSIVTNVIQVLQETGLIRGASLCGAGGGGFMVLMTQSGISLSDMQSTIVNDPHVDQEAVDAFTWHTCQVCMEGLTVKVLLDDDIPYAADYFSTDWLL